MKRFVLSFVVCLFLVSCASKQPVDRSKDLSSSYKYKFDMVKAYLEGGDYKKAKMGALELLKEKKEPMVLNMLGLSYLGLGELEKAKGAFLEAVSLDPRFSPAWNNLAVCYLREGRPKKAVEAARRALANPFYLFPERAYTNMALAYFRLNEPQKAVEYLKRAIKYNVYYAPAYEELLKYYLENDNLSAAKDVLFDAQVAGVNSPGIIFYRALVYVRDGKLQKAKELLKGLLRDYASTPWAKKARIYLETLE